MARTAELSVLVRNESKCLTKMKQMHLNLQQKHISQASTPNPFPLYLFHFFFPVVRAGLLLSLGL